MSDGHAYHMFGWLVQAGAEGARFTNDFTGHGMFVSVDGIQTF